MKSFVPISYPGGKTRVVKKILSPLFPSFEGDFYDPFVGGGSIALWVAQLYPDKNIHINDLNDKLYIFWKQLKENHEQLIEKLLEVREEHDPEKAELGRELLKKENDILYDEKSTEFEMAVAYFVLNKISFSGLTEHGSLSKDNYWKKFNPLNVNKLRDLNKIMKNFIIDNIDYETFINGHSPDSFIFLDPPYRLKTRNTLYGKNGEMHEGFDHDRFAEVVKKIKGKFMITYNDCEENRENFKDYKILDQEYRYYMVFKEDEVGNKVTRKKNELIIINY